MKCLIFSDAHGDTWGMEAALARHPDASVVFFLGDGRRQAELLLDSYPALVRIVVSGNCDVSFSLPADEEALVDVCGLRILAFHGHRYGVKYGIGAAVEEAEKRGADVLLFGHTHEPMTDYRAGPNGSPVWVLNPGSIRSGSYGTLEIRDGKPLFSLTSL